MMVALGLFMSSAAFAIVIAVAYWFVAREIVGTMLLGFMAFGLCLLAGYTIFAERDANLAGDSEIATPSSAAGDVLGSFTTHSPLPIWSALIVACLALGIVVSPALAILSILTLLVLGALFILQSR